MLTRQLRRTTAFLATAAIALAGSAAAEPGKNPAGDVPESIQRLQEDFLDLNVGMFIHYNMATYHGVQWVEGYPDPSTFNPGGEVDTDAWADAAVSAGMTYAVLTAKHVGGFCLWDSKHTTYDVMHPDCPYQRDLVAQFIKSFKSRGLKVGLYYAWRHPGFAAKYKVLPPECDPATHSMPEQIDFQKKQIAELIEKYPDVFYIWNDALDPGIMPAEEAKAFFRSTRRDILASSNWWDWGKKGRLYLDIAVKELRHFPEDNTLPGETCWKLEQGWFWNEGARSGNVKGIMGHLTKSLGRNSNFLLNVGPDKRGEILPSSRETLKKIGEARKTENEPAPDAGKTVQLPGMTINPREGYVDLEATVCLDEGMLELIACAKGSKEHESILAVEAQPMHIHAALLMLGSEPGHPAMRKPVNEEQTRWIHLPPRGDHVDLSLVIKDADGETVERPIGQFVTRIDEDPTGPDFGNGPPAATNHADTTSSANDPTDEKSEDAFPSTFLFAGSHVVKQESGPALRV